jgi:hypothetical protein
VAVVAQKEAHAIAKTGPFDRIVSVGMFEHVSASHYREFFRKVEGSAERRWRCSARSSPTTWSSTGFNEFLHNFLLPTQLHGRIHEAAGKLIERVQIANVLTLKNLFDQDPALAQSGQDLFLRRELIGLGEENGQFRPYP